MKKWLMIILVFAGVASARAAPYLVCDSPPAGECVTSYLLILDGGTAIATSAPLRYDLAGIAVGAHTLTAFAVCDDPVWGHLESASSAPFSFARPKGPSSVAKLDISKQ